MKFNESKNLAFNPSHEMQIAMITLEKKRQILKKHKKNPIVVHSIGFVIYCIFFMTFFPLIGTFITKISDSALIKIVLTFASFFGLAFIYIMITNSFLKPHKNADSYQRIYTDHIAIPMLKSIDESFTYQRNGGFKEKFPHLDLPSNEFEDFICANINGINFSLAEYLDPDDESTHDKSKNFCFVADFNKNIHSSTILYPLKLGYYPSYPQHKKILLDNEKFNKTFFVYSKDEVEARYILTPSFMEKILNLETDLVGTYEFIDNKILFYGHFIKNMKINIFKKKLDAFSKNDFDLFDIKPDVSICEQTKQTYDNLIKILSFIHKLDLDSKVWK